MATPITFKAQTVTQQADAILRQDKAKLQWFKMDFADMPAGIQQLAISAVNAGLAAKEARQALQSALDDKVEAPAGKRLVVTLGRDVSPSTDGVLIAWANASAGQTRSLSFAEFIKAK